MKNSDIHAMIRDYLEETDARKREKLTSLLREQPIYQDPSGAYLTETDVLDLSDALRRTGTPLPEEVIADGEGAFRPFMESIPPHANAIAWLNVFCPAAGNCPKHIFPLIGDIVELRYDNILVVTKEATGKMCHVTLDSQDISYQTIRKFLIEGNPPAGLKVVSVG